VEIIALAVLRTHCVRRGIEVRDVSDVTGFSGNDGRPHQDLHPKIHGALLALRDNPEHQTAMHEHQIEPIDMSSSIYIHSNRQSRVKELTLEKAIEKITSAGRNDSIGGKNHRDRRSLSSIRIITTRFRG